MAEGGHTQEEYSVPPSQSILQSQDSVAAVDYAERKTSARNLSNHRNGQPNLPQITKEEEDFERQTLSKEDRLLAFVDLYGRKAPANIDSDRRLEAFDREMRRLPAERKAALYKGYTVQQARLFLDIENNDAKRAVERMARYWDKRLELFGEDTFLFGRKCRTVEDFRRVYEMALESRMDPEVDEETRGWAEGYVSEWNRGHLMCLDEELAAIPYQAKTALVKATKARPDIVTSDEHRLLFLRAEDFDAKRASLRMVKYWTSRYDLFGNEGAFHPLTVNELMREHPLELSLGCVWNIKGTDASGRTLVFCSPGNAFASVTKEEGYTEDGVLKVIWYIVHALLEEEESCLEKGIVILIDDRNTKSVNVKLASKVQSIWFDSLPVNIKAIHAFPPPHLSFLKLFLPFLKWMMGTRLRMRLWVHTGTEENFRSDLEECGIPRDLIPTTLGGNFDTDRVGKAWLEERRQAGL